MFAGFVKESQKENGNFSIAFLTALTCGAESQKENGNNVWGISNRAR